MTNAPAFPALPGIAGPVGHDPHEATMMMTTSSHHHHVVGEEGAVYMERMGWDNCEEGVLKQIWKYNLGKQGEVEFPIGSIHHKSRMSHISVCCF